MIVTIPSVVESFCTLCLGSLGKAKRRLLPMLLSGVLLAIGKRSQERIGTTVRTERRHRASISRLLRRCGFQTRDLYREAMREIVRGEERRGTRGERKRTWLLTIDGTNTRRGSKTRIENARQYREKQKKYGPSTKSFTFVMGILITESGKRIPMPRMTWYTRAYCRKHGRKYCTQMTLAARMIRDARKTVPADVDLVVTADEYFESVEVWKACQELEVTLIVPVNSARCFADARGKSNGVHLWDRGKSLSRGMYERIELIRGREETASYRRYSRSRFSRTSRRRYRAHHERRGVAGLGEAGVVYSWKEKSSSHARASQRETYKVLITNDLTLSAAEILEWYELRWQIEIFFRELKSDLGLCDYTGQDFRAYERFIDLILLAFLFLEWFREVRLKEAGVPRIRSLWQRARTAPLIGALRQEATRQDIEYVHKRMRTAEGRREIIWLLPSLLAA